MAQRASKASSDGPKWDHLEPLSRARWSDLNLYLLIETTSWDHSRWKGLHNTRIRYASEGPPERTRNALGGRLGRWSAYIDKGSGGPGLNYHPKMAQRASKASSDGPKWDHLEPLLKNFERLLATWGVRLRIFYVFIRFQ